MKKKNLLLLALLLVGLCPAWAAHIDTLSVKSPSMNKQIQVVVVAPDVAFGKNAVTCPVIYLLHGYGGNAKSWITIKPNLPQIADERGILTGRTAGIGTVHAIRPTATKRLFLLNW